MPSVTATRPRSRVIAGDGVLNLRAVLAAPLAIYPTALVFISARALLTSDPRELFVAPLSALVVTVVGYPFALGCAWLVGRLQPGWLQAARGLSMLLAAVGAEVVFWGLISPFWQRDFSPAFCAALVAACGAATAWAYVTRRGVGR